MPPNLGVYRDVSYASPPSLALPHDPRRLFDLFCPQPPRAGGVPLLVFIHGGLWRAGDKSEHAALAKAWASSPDHPVAVAVVNYRLSAREGRPVRYPDHVQDCAAAVKWFRGPGRAQCYGYDPDRIFLVGHSSGAQLAGVLVLNPRWLGEDWRAVRGVVGVQGLYDLPGLVAAKPGLLEFVEGAFGPRAEEERRNWIYASPQYLKLEKQYRMPPWLLVHSPEDDALPPDGTAKFRDHLRALVAAEPGNAGGRDGPEVRVQMVTQASGSHYEVLLGGEFAALVASFVDSVWPGTRSSSATLAASPYASSPGSAGSSRSSLPIPGASASAPLASTSASLSSSAGSGNGFMPIGSPSSPLSGGPRSPIARDASSGSMGSGKSGKSLGSFFAAIGRSKSLRKKDGAG